jgi:molybdate transport system substrate-binding protein
MSKQYRLLSIVLALLIVSGLFLGCSGTTTTSTGVPATTSTAGTSVVPSTSSTTSPAATTTSTPASTAVTPTSTSTTALTPVTINLSAAASLTDAIKEIDALYMKENPNVTITANFASSGTLQKQIEQGAPADLFISAAAAQMNTLEKEGLILSHTRKDLLKNTLVLIVPADSTLGISSFKDLTGDSVKQIAIGDPKSVPAGSYAQKAFDELGITAQVKGKYVMGSDVKAVLSYVESGNVDAGLVYLTDAKLSTKVKVVANAPDDINAQIIYPMAIVFATKVSQDTLMFQYFLVGDAAKAIFEKYGFTVIEQ